MRRKGEADDPKAGRAALGGLTIIPLPIRHLARQLERGSAAATDEAIGVLLTAHL